MSILRSPRRLLALSIAPTALASLAVATIATSIIAAPLPGATVIDDLVRADDVRWQVVNDSVMGGVSESQAERTADGAIRFTGTLSLENNGGFVSLRSRGELGLDDTTGLRVRVRGDGRKYYLSVDRSDVRIPAGGYWASFQTVADEWVEIDVPYADFVPTSFGREIRAPRLAEAPDRIVSVGVLLADYNPGALALDIDSIEPIRPASSSSQREVVADARGTSSTNAAPASDPVSFLRPLAQNDDLGTIRSLLRLTGITDRLAGADLEWTLLAPRDGAFSHIDEDAIAYLTSDEGRDDLVRILSQHLILERANALELATNRTVATALGQSLPIAYDRGSITIGDATIVRADQRVGNGIVHVIDSVLIPAEPEPARNPSSGSNLPATAVGVVIDAIDRGVPLFNEGEVRACAELYRSTVVAIVALGDLHPNERDRFRGAIARAERSNDAREQAWIYRDAMDAFLSADMRRASR